MLFLVPPCASIPGGRPSRTYYQVLGISPDEQDPRVIEEAALGCSGHVRAYQLTCEPECALRLNEIAQALITLLDPDRRREYDRGLGKPSSLAVIGAPATRSARRSCLAAGPGCPSCPGGGCPRASPR